MISGQIYLPKPSYIYEVVAVLGAISVIALSLIIKKHLSKAAYSALLYGGITVEVAAMLVAKFKPKDTELKLSGDDNNRNLYIVDRNEKGEIVWVQITFEEYIQFDRLIPDETFFVRAWAGTEIEKEIWGLEFKGFVNARLKDFIGEEDTQLSLTQLRQIAKLGLRERLKIIDPLHYKLCLKSGEAFEAFIRKDGELRYVFVALDETKKHTFQELDFETPNFLDLRKKYKLVSLEELDKKSEVEAAQNNNGDS